MSIAAGGCTPPLLARLLLLLGAEDSAELPAVAATESGALLDPADAFAEPLMLV
jgi:hypothetical protein